MGATRSGLLVYLAVFALPSFAQFSPPERLTIVTDDNYPPYLFRDADGRLHGMVQDKWQLWSKKTGIPITLEGMEWAKAQRHHLDGGADVIEGVASTDGRAQFYEFSPAWDALETRVFFHSSIGGISDVASLRGFTIGTKEGSACTPWLQQRGIQALRIYPDSEALVRAAGSGEIRLFCSDVPVAQYFLLKHGLTDEFRQSPPLYSKTSHWAVRKTQVELRNFIQAGFERISANELQEIDDRWIGHTVGLPLRARYYYYVAPVAAILLAAAALLVLWNRSLRQRVAARTYELGERVKELAVLHATARLFHSERSIDHGLLMDLALLLPRGWQFPDVCVARIAFGDLEAFTPGWRETPWRLSAPFGTHEGYGLIEVSYLDARPTAAEGPFLAEERRLIDSLAEMLGAQFERIRVQTALRESALQLRELSRRLLEVEENERRNINRELHDRIAQNISALQLSLGTLRLELPGSAREIAERRLDDAQALLETTSNQVRDVMAELRPAALDDFGLLAALRDHAAATSKRLGIAIRVSGLDPEPRLPLDVEIALFRIVQEALNNVAKHARARQVEVTLSLGPRTFALSVADDGAGFDAARPLKRHAHYGIATMRERAEAVGARLTIESTPGRGACVRVDLAHDATAVAA